MSALLAVSAALVVAGTLLPGLFRLFGQGRA